MKFPSKLLTAVVLLFFLWRLSALPADIASIELSSFFNNNMVLQHGRQNLIWGKATPRDQIQITIAGMHTCTTVNDDGTWSVYLPELPIGGPYELSAKGINENCVHNILVGDVWLCAGQSNMDMSLETAIHSSSDITESNYPMVRFFKETPNALSEPGSDLYGTWCTVNPRTVRSCSAVGYYFAREVFNGTKIPIGIIQCAKSSTSIKAWMSKGALGGTRRQLSNCNTSALFNGMIAPLFKVNLKGIVWYQGESDVFEGSYKSYRKLLSGLFDDWRHGWHQATLPFLCVQIPNYFQSYEEPTDSPWAQLREAQFQACNSTPDTYMTVSIDTGEGKSVDIHPKSKREIGHRLALTALGAVYTHQCSFVSPSYSGIQIVGNRMRISFKDVGKGLIVKGIGTEGFAVAGADQRFCWAKAEIGPTNNEVLVWSENVPKPVAVRYAWADNPKCNLYSEEGLPVVPFRTDHWKNDSVRQYAAFWTTPDEAKHILPN